MKSIDVILVPLGTATFALSSQWRRLVATLGRKLTPSVSTLSYKLFIQTRFSNFNLTQ